MTVLLVLIAQCLTSRPLAVLAQLMILPLMPPVPMALRLMIPP